MKKIIHIDMDCFFAAVEMRDDPKLRDIPIAIGGSADRRGVISTCNYPARKFGIRSAMATAQALKRCPGLTVLRGNMEKYKQVSHQIREIFRRYTDRIEPLSLDEAYLDVTESDRHRGSATLIADEIRQTIERELGLTASAGVAPVKFLAKIASDINKPNGQFVITPEEVDSFVKTLPLEKIPGVGKVTINKLHQLDLYTGADIQDYDQALLLRHFGKLGHSLWRRAHGLDNRDVDVVRVRKSVGVERTFPNDLYSRDDCLPLVESLFEELTRRLERVLQQRTICRQGIKLKFNDFTQTTVEHRCAELDRIMFDNLLDEALERQEGRGIRLLGLSVGLNTENEKQQLSLWQ